jgi:5-methylcytosine-specific restriction enzyme subunit McrC
MEVRLSEWDRKGPDTDDILKDLTLQKLGTSADQLSGIEETRGVTFRELRTGLEISTTSYVGRIQVGKLSVAISPKIQGMPLARLIRYAYGLRDLHLHSLAEHWTDQSALVDLLLVQLLQELKELIARGLVRKYSRRPENLASPRGKIDLVSLAKRGGRFDATVPCIHHPRTYDWLPNRILAQGLLAGAHLTGDPEIRSGLRRLYSLLETSVPSCRLDWKSVNDALNCLDRQSRAYLPALTIVRLLVEGQGVVFGQGSELATFKGFLFDMNRFFQQLLLRFFQEHIRPETVRSELPLNGMIQFETTSPGRRAGFRSPRPDFAIVHNGQSQNLLDAKYRDIWGQSIPRDWTYQLSMYALANALTPEATILYPTLALDAVEEKILISHPVNRKHLATVRLRPVKLLALADLVSSGARSAFDERKQLARHLCFGQSLN